MALVPMLDLRPKPEAEPIGAAALEAEMALLGIALYEMTSTDGLDDFLPEHFLEPVFGRIWSAARDLVRKGRVSEPIAVWSAMETDPGLIDYGGLRFLVDLVDRAPPAVNAAHYAAIIVAQAKSRQLGRLADWTRHAVNTGVDTEETIEGLEKGLAALAHSGPQSSDWRGVGIVVDDAIERGMRATGLAGVSTGLTDLDAATGGFRKGQMITLAGRPGMGKSSGGVAIGKAVAKAGKGVVFFSMEMPVFDLGLRVAVDEAHDRFAPFYSGKSTNPTYFDASKGELDGGQWRALKMAADRVRDLPLEFDPRPGLTVAQMLSASRRKFREWEKAGIEPGLIVVDHLTIARADQDRRGNKVAEVGDISRGLAEMAKTLDVPVLALCQLSRDVEKRDAGQKRPTLSDLRWSGEIEQDSRLVMFLYRPEYYLKRPEDRDDFEANATWKAKMEKVRHKLFWLIEKNNNGPTGEVETYCDIACSAIRNRNAMVTES
jgi:replicative DNA helicase